MNSKFDIYNNYEIPQLILTNPNEEEIDNNIRNNYNVIKKIEFEKQYHINEKQLELLINMTPLLKNRVKSSKISLDNITISLNIYVLNPMEKNKWTNTKK